MEDFIRSFIKSYISRYSSKEEALEYYREDPSIFEAELIDAIEAEMGPIEGLIKASPDKPS